MAQSFATTTATTPPPQKSYPTGSVAGLSPSSTVISSSHQLHSTTATTNANTPMRPSVSSFGAPSAVMTSPSLSTNDGFFGRESRTDSIGTLWSSADVPLFLDGHRGSNGEQTLTSSMTARSSISSTSQGFTSRSGSTAQNAARNNANPPKARSSHVQSNKATLLNGGSADDETLLCDDGNAFVAVRPAPRPPRSASGSPTSLATKAKSDGWTVTQDVASTTTKNVALLQKPGSRPGSSTSASTVSQANTLRKHRPTQLDLASSGSETVDVHTPLQAHHHAERPTHPALQRNVSIFDVPASVSDGSQMTFASSVKSKLHAIDSKSAVASAHGLVSSTSAATRQQKDTSRTQPSDLYRHAERFFDVSYSMAAPSPVPTPSSSLTPASMDTTRISRFSDDSHSTFDDSRSLLGPTDALPLSHAAERIPHSYAPSHNSLSSTESSNPPEVDELNGHTLKGDTLRASNIDEEDRKAYEGHEQMNMTPLRVAMSLGAASTAVPVQIVTPVSSFVSSHVVSTRRPSTTDATRPSVSARPTQTRPETARHKYTTSDQETLQRFKDDLSHTGKTKTPQTGSTSERLAFLNNPAPSSSTLPSPQKRGSLFGLRSRAVSTPKLRQSRGSSQDGPVAALSAGMASSATLDRDVRPTSSSRAQYPPPAPSGRFRSAVDADELERCNSAGSALSTHVAGATVDESQQQSRSRRSSSSEAWAAATRRFRRPSRAGSNTSLNGSTALPESGSGSRQRLGSSASSQMQGELRHANSNASLVAGSGSALHPRRGKVSTPTGSSSSRPKTKGGWASYLAQGLTLHIEQGSMKFACRMNYSYYDPFGRPESLCSDEHGQINKARGSISNPGFASRNGSFSVASENEPSLDDQIMGVLDFTPESCSSGASSSTTKDGGESASVNHLTFLASDVGVHGSPAVLKHLTIGEDTRADLITRQANLSLAAPGIHEVSGSERKGTVSWKFVFAVEDIRGPTQKGGEEFKLLRPLRFSCSTTLLDPARARKSRMFNMIRKQIGSNIESHSVPASSLNIDLSGAKSGKMDNPVEESSSSYSPVSARSDVPLSPRTLPRAHAGRTCDALPFANGLSTDAPVLRAARSSNGSEGLRGSFAGSDEQQLLQQQYVAGLRNGSVASMASSVTSTTWSPQGRGLRAFKVRKSTVEAIRGAAGRTSVGEQGNGSAAANSAVLATSPLALSASMLTSPATSVDGSVSSPGKSIRDLGSIASTQADAIAIAAGRQQHYARHTRGPAPATALGLETNEFNDVMEATQKGAVEEEIDWREASTAGQWASSRSRTRVRRMRTATEQPHGNAELVDSLSVVRPATASEEIKMAYLNNVVQRDVPTAAQRRQRNGHAHSHSVTQTGEPTAFRAAPATQQQQQYENTLLIPPRRLTSVSINASPRPTVVSGMPAAHAPYAPSPPSPLREKRLPPPPAKRGPISAVASAARVLSGPTSHHHHQQTTARGQFDAPEGAYWV